MNAHSFGRPKNGRGKPRNHDLSDIEVELRKEAVEIYATNGKGTRYATILEIMQGRRDPPRNDAEVERLSRWGVLEVKKAIDAARQRENRPPAKKRGGRRQGRT